MILLFPTYLITLFNLTDDLHYFKRNGRKPEGSEASSGVKYFVFVLYDKYHCGLPTKYNDGRKDWQNEQR
jgi:hypothetical protein